MELEIYSDYVQGLKDIDGASHLIVLYWLHLAKRDVLQTKTPFGPDLRGVFACRSPSRPNPIAFCVAKLLHREENRLSAQGCPIPHLMLKSLLASNQMWFSPACLQTRPKQDPYLDREKLISWNPDILFTDAGGLQLVKDDYKKDPKFYQSLSAVKKGEVYCLIPYNWYWTNIETALADAYYAGKVICPDQFKDIDPVKKADEIYKFLW